MQTNRRVFLKGATVVALGAAADPASAAGEKTDATDQGTFIALSLVLTGMTAKELPTQVEQNDAQGRRLKLYEVYFERLRSAYPTEFQELLKAWRQIEGESDPEAALSVRLGKVDASGERLRVAARQVVKIWYLSTLDDPRSRPNPQNGRNTGQLGGDLGQYQHSAIWKLVDAPVPGYSDMTHGYWADKPGDSPARGPAPPSSAFIDFSPLESGTSVELPDG